MQPDNNPAREQHKPQRLGTISVIIGIITGLGTCLYLIVVGIMVIGTGDFGVTVSLLCINGVQSIIGLLNLSGLILGILALVRREAKKGIAIVGLLLNIIAIFLSIFILWNSIPFYLSMIK